MPKKRVLESNRSVPRRGYLWQLSSLNGLLRSMRFNADKLPRFRFFFPFFPFCLGIGRGPRKNIPTILNSIPSPTARLQLFQAHNCHQRTRIKFCRHKKQKKVECKWRRRRQNDPHSHHPISSPSSPSLSVSSANGQTSPCRRLECPIHGDQSNAQSCGYDWSPATQSLAAELKTK
ncbi:hypothetical protein BJX66DRAFT_207735 [Aspergillus keveii]|uniref:Uncharacterized protein n=1 Tax=Aspergillus keveii TaxID=714993 RepID=A0ABR4G4V3_9EURO